MRYRLAGGAFVVAGLIAPGLAAAMDAIDCETLKASAVPYELQMRQNDTKTYPMQVYRGKNLTRLQYTKIQSHILISRFQANFHLEYLDLGGTNVRFTYSVPTDRYIWQQDTRVVTYNTIISGAATAGPGFTQVYELLPDEVFPLEGCSFPVKHFRFKQASGDKTSDEEIWFSPELNTNLRLIGVTTSPNGKTTRKLEAAAIATGMAPFQ